MPNGKETCMVLGLSILMFYAASETVVSMEQRGLFSPTYLVFTLISVLSMVAVFVCLLSLHRAAEKKTKKGKVMVQP